LLICLRARLFDSFRRRYFSLTSSPDTTTRSADIYFLFFADTDTDLFIAAFIIFQRHGFRFAAISCRHAVYDSAQRRV